MLFAEPLDLNKILVFFREYNVPNEKTDILLHKIITIVTEDNLPIVIGCYRNMMRSLCKSYPNIILDFLNRVANVQINKSFIEDYLVKITKLIRKNLKQFSEQELEEIVSILENFRKFDRIVFKTILVIKHRRLDLDEKEDIKLL